MTGRAKGNAADGPVPLVLLPGTLCDATLFEPMLAAIPFDGPVIVADISGGSSAAALATEVLANAPPRFALAGFSLGGIIAIEIALRAPARVAGFALIGSTACPVPAAERQQRRARVAAMRSATELLQSGWRAQVGPRHRGDLHLRDTLIAMAERGGMAALLSQTEVALTRSDHRPRLSTLAMPSLVLAGREDGINPPAVQQELATLLADSALEFVPGAGHFLPLEMPEATAAAVHRWLVRVDGAVHRGHVTVPERLHAAAGR